MMKSMNEIKVITASRDYENRFWDAMCLKSSADANMRDAWSGNTGAFYAPAAANEAIRTVIASENVIRSLATNLKKYDGSSKIWAAESDDYAAFVPEGAPIPGFDAEDDFTRFAVGCYKIAGLIKLSSAFVRDADFDLRKYVSGRMGKSFAKTEESAFVNGSGLNEPTGLLHETEGAETGVTTNALSYDDCIDLFFSVKPEYRAHAVWLMNDRTALALRKLKDADGNYLWNSANDTILGRPVRICNEMPDVAAGTKPILFGDLAYYWIVDRSPVSMKALEERFIMNDQIGYIGFEMLDARLVRRDAVKAIATSDR